MNFYEDFVIKSHPTGSNYICNPPVTDTDIDTVILAKPGYEPSLVELGWDLPNDYGNLSEFWSWRKGNKNYIVTTSSTFYKRFVLATKACKGMNVLSKAGRIAIFDAILYNEKFTESPVFEDITEQTVF